MRDDMSNLYRKQGRYHGDLVEVKARHNDFTRGNKDDKRQCNKDIRNSNKELIQKELNG